jgi:nucleoid DNA-binding protein
MTKEKFAAQLAKEMRAQGFRINAPNAEKLIIALAKSMGEGLARDRKLIVSNFGSFEVVKYGAKMIQSPRGDNKKFFMPPTDVMKWHPSGKIRQRAVSEEVEDDEYKKLVGNPVEEIDAPAVFIQKEEMIETSESAKSKTDPYAVKVTYAGKVKSYLSDDHSPISKFVKSILSLMKTFGADKLEIVPGKIQTQILYSNVEGMKNQKVLPKDSHAVIIQKIEALAGSANELLLFGTDRVKLSRKLTPFGYQLTIVKI